MSADARTSVLASIRSAKGSTSALAPAQAAWEQIPRGYDLGPGGEKPVEATLELLVDRLLDYDATVVRCTPAEIPARLAELAETLKLESIGLPTGFAPSLLPPGLPLIPDTGQTNAELDRISAVLTMCTVAIAETGTIVLTHGPGEGRRAMTLVPDTHLCIVRADQVVRSVPEAIAQLEPHATAPTTFVSGPSATADIEMTRIKGVHGPRFLHVLLVV